MFHVTQGLFGLWLPDSLSRTIRLPRPTRAQAGSYLSAGRTAPMGRSR